MVQRKATGPKCSRLIGDVCHEQNVFALCSFGLIKWKVILLVQRTATQSYSILVLYTLSKQDSLTWFVFSCFITWAEFSILTYIDPMFDSLTCCSPISWISGKITQCFFLVGGIPSVTQASHGNIGPWESFLMHPLDPSWNKYKVHDWGNDWWIFFFVSLWWWWMVILGVAIVVEFMGLFSNMYYRVFDYV